MNFDNSKLASWLPHVLYRPKCELSPPHRLPLDFPIKMAIIEKQKALPLPLASFPFFPFPSCPERSLFLSPQPRSLQHKRGFCGGERNAKINVVAYGQDLPKFSVILFGSFHKFSVTTTSNLCENEIISMSRGWGKEKI